ncbi:MULTISPECIES: 4-hydroxythreonine-4-phosphate dehydrogenase PdxA [Prochlorococcus]|uniref:4-hydroxythreonine-4-phosphate dehydrogenase PdxA n=1 Tax=Prochlorococcus TaxID=1218 RepID=UPI000533A31C|nr:MULTISPECIES: 4-hydroxythreonine-4-phosphate dehydrogenase PdxA [Prochlorococcus]KGG13364.1 4-hydroxythreonine-4-phosphate dehydrogenase [Prochlorococcus sp. MIT 0601]
MKKNNTLIITLGDPAGIGPEVTLKALASNELPNNLETLLVGCKKTINGIYASLKEKGVYPLANPKDLNIENIPCKENFAQGKANASSGKASFDWLTRASELVLSGSGKGLVTAPISKHAWTLAGHCYPGQTERLGELTKSQKTSMLFTATSPYNGWKLNTLLATTHIPLIDISKELTPELITSKLNALLEFCLMFKENPTLCISGLNPHAGENGQLGKEELEWLIPTIQQWKKSHPNFVLKGPISPDVCWMSSAKAWQGNEIQKAPDGILALYHDQGLIPIKLIAFEFAVNTTLGLPFVRTSPDHGTGFDIAGTGKACCKSMLSAIKTAWELSN